MPRRLLLILGLSLAAAAPGRAGTFDRAPLAPEVGLDALTRGVARERVGRDLFAQPYATVTLASVDVYDRFPYVETRRRQVVSDARWHRLLIAEPGAALAAWNGAGTALGALREPRGLDADEHGVLYVADTGNDRVVALGAAPGRGGSALEPRFAVGGLSRPHDVAYSDGGTPFVAGDDFLLVAETGRNRVALVALEAGGGRVVATLGELGSGTGRFAGPTAIAAGPARGAAGGEVFVADAHNRRVVRLRRRGAALEWLGEARHALGLVTSLDVDAWGNVYAAAPHEGVVLKLGPALEPVAELRGGLTRPRAFHVPAAVVRDHRDGSRARVGQPFAVSVDDWSAASGVALWRLGVEVRDLAVPGGDRPAARFTLTDRAEVALETRSAATGRLLRRRALGALDAGRHEVALGADDLAGARDVVVRLAAVSSYPDGARASAEASAALGAGGPLPAQAVLLGCAPNPGAAPRIAFVLPPSEAAGAALRVFDASGRAVRRFAGFGPGWNEVAWNGADDRGRRVPAGVYFVRLDAGGRSVTRSTVLVD